MQVVIHSQPQNDTPGLSLGDPLARAGRLILHRQMEQVAPVDWCVKPGEAAELAAPSQPVAGQPGADLPDAGQVHRLRVATRKLRTTLRVFRPYYKAKAVQPVARGLRDLAAVLTRVREQDVTVRALREYQQAADEETRSALQPILEAWQQAQAVDRRACAEHLAGERHAAWLRDLAIFTQSEAADRALKPGQPYTLRHALDAILARHLEAVRAYDTLPDQPYVGDIHSLRIAVKRLRYLCETLREVLPAERAEAVTAACEAAQAQYGTIVDARLSAQRALHFVSEHRAEYDNPLALRGILSFARAQHQLVNERMAGWRQFLEPLLML